MIPIGEICDTVPHKLEGSTHVRVPRWLHAHAVNFGMFILFCKKNNMVSAFSNLDIFSKWLQKNLY